MQRIFDWTLSLFLLLSPVFTFRNYEVSFARGIFFICGVLILQGISLMCEQKRTLKDKWLGIFFLLAFIPVFFSGNEFFDFWGSLFCFFYVLCGVLLFKIVYCHSSGTKEYIKPIIAVCILNFVLALCQSVNFDFMWLRTHGLSKICGFMETSTQLGQYSAMTFPIIFSFNPFLSIIPLFTLIMSKSSSPIIALLVAMLFSGWHYKKRFVVLIISSGILLWCILNFSYIHAKFYTRPIMWKKTLSIALQKPYLGWGYKTFDSKVVGIKDKMGNLASSHAYNDYFHTAQELGFPILIVGGMFFYGIFKRFNIVAYKSKLLIGLSGSIVVVLVNMAGQGVIRYASISGTFLVLLALFFAEVNNDGWKGKIKWRLHQFKS